MKEKDQDSRLDSVLLDRLVDGELGEAEYRDLLQGLESQPDGWRRCALAFLEAQAWGRDLRALRSERHERMEIKPAESQWRRHGFYLGAMAVACAASFVLAFGVAMRLQDSAKDPSSPHDLAAESTSNSVDSISDGNMQFAGPLATPNEAEVGNPQLLPLGQYQLVVDGGSGTPQAVHMPVFAADDPRANLLLDEYASKPHEIIRALENSGHDVQSFRNWIPVRGHSGTRLYVPVDELQVTPVSNRSFQ